MLINNLNQVNAVIVSLRFNPGHFSHLVANYKLMEEFGYCPYLYVHHSFNEMDCSNIFNKINTVYDLKQVGTIDVAIFWFPSIMNIIEIIRLKYLYRSNIIYVFHEPFESIRSYYKSGFGLVKILKICLISVVNITIVVLSNKIILPSLSALSIYEKKFKKLNTNYTAMPLLFDDELVETLGVSSKKYVSYIGTIAADHAFDKFIHFIRECLEYNWFPELQFLIATSSKVPLDIKNCLDFYIKKGLVVIAEGSYMTNELINTYYRDSFIVWNAYNRSMQSGVLPKAYMFGASVIVLLKNKNEFIINHITGVLVNDNGNVVELRRAIEEILAKREFFYKNCRKFFLNSFFYRCRKEQFQKLL